MGQNESVIPARAGRVPPPDEETDEETEGEETDEETEGEETGASAAASPPVARNDTNRPEKTKENKKKKPKEKGKEDISDDKNAEVAVPDNGPDGVEEEPASPLLDDGHEEPIVPDSAAKAESSESGTLIKSDKSKSGRRGSWDIVPVVRAAAYPKGKPTSRALREVMSLSMDMVDQAPITIGRQARNAKIRRPEPESPVVQAKKAKKSSKKKHEKKKGAAKHHKAVDRFAHSTSGSSVVESDGDSDTSEEFGTSYNDYINDVNKDIKPQKKKGGKSGEEGRKIASSRWPYTTTPPTSINGYRRPQSLVPSTVVPHSTTGSRALSNLRHVPPTTGNRFPVTSTISAPSPIVARTPYRIAYLSSGLVNSNPSSSIFPSTASSSTIARRVPPANYLASVVKNTPIAVMRQDKSSDEFSKLWDVIRTHAPSFQGLSEAESKESLMKEWAGLTQSTRNIYLRSAGCKPSEAREQQRSDHVQRQVTTRAPTAGFTLTWAMVEDIRRSSISDRQMALRCMNRVMDKGRRRFIFEADRGENLSDVLKELRERNEAEAAVSASAGHSSSSSTSRLPDMASSFERSDGMVHLEALELVATSRPKQRQSVHRQLMALLENERVDAIDNDEDFAAELREAVRKTGLQYSPDGIINVDHELDARLRAGDGLSSEELFREGVDSLVQFTAASVHLVSKLASLFAVMGGSDFHPFVALHRTLATRCTHIANLYMLAISASDEGSAADELGTQVLVEASTAIDFIRQAHALLIPILETK